jgi:hypothetical protein
LGAASALLVYLLAWVVLGALDLSPGRRAQSSFLGGGVIALLSRETLVSHGMVYWSHSLYQIFLGALLILLYKVLVDSASGQRLSNILCVSLLLISYVGGLVEWTGIIFPTLASFAIALSPRYRHTRISLILLVAASASVATIAIHFSMALGPRDFIATSLSRFLSRSAKSATVFHLIKGYVISYGPWLLVCAISGLLVGVRKLRAALRAHGVAIILILSLLPLIENLFLLQHASQFSFDRLKAIFPIGIYLSICLAICSDIQRRLLTIGIMAASVISILHYQFEIKAAREFSPVHQYNLSVVEGIGNSIDLGCTSISSSMKVRGYDNVLFKRAIHEHQKSPKDAWESMKRHGGCGSVWIDGFQYAPDIPSYQKAVVMFLDGSSREIKPTAK